MSDSTGYEVRTRLGWALSGGGFRAAFFHLGVMAQMARLGLLRHVEALSTVSGGSIIGTLYYIHVKRLLERLPDEEITDRHYVELVEEVERAFLAGVQKNVRMRAAIDIERNLKMALPSYSRTDRLGELYDEIFYRPAWGTKRDRPIEMRELIIQPAGASPGFSPRTMNAARRAKVPILTLNACSLNTGRAWHFTAMRMGEPPSNDDISREIDKRDRLRRAEEYDHLPPVQATIPVGLAVAASSCVPGLFPPLALSNLYPGVRVQLVDGGAYDNQGVTALLNLGCDRVVVSDASGQMDFVAAPGTSMLEVIGRVSTVVTDRVRDLELRALLGAEHVALLHLRKGLDATAIPWLRPDGSPAGEAVPERTPDRAPESFGVSREVQARLAAIRTDLDSFTTVEAQALMLDGYLMAGDELPRHTAIASMTAAPPDAPSDATPERWGFLAMKGWLARPTRDFLAQLDVSQSTLFKYFALAPSVRAVALAALAVAVIVLGALFVPHLPALLGARVAVWHILLLLLVPIVYVCSNMLDGARGAKRVVAWFGHGLYLVTLHPILCGLVSILARLDLKFGDPLYLSRGRPERLTPPPRSE